MPRFKEQARIILTAGVRPKHGAAAADGLFKIIRNFGLFATSRARCYQIARIVYKDAYLKTFYPTA